MPVSIYDSADAAAASGHLDHLLRHWEVLEPVPVKSLLDIENYESKISALVPYITQNENVKNSVLAMRKHIIDFLSR